MSEWAIRGCRPGEMHALLSLWQQAEATPSVTDTVADIQRVLTDSQAVVLVAEADGRLIGSVIGTFDGWRGHIYRLAVHPAFRRRGLGRALVAEIQSRLAMRGARRIIALVEKDHAWAMAFWGAVGYQIDPRIVRFVQNL